MIEQFINFVIRPPRADYNPDQYLWEKEFSLGGKNFCRQDLEIQNERGHALQCSHYMPSDLPEATRLPCVIYCHGNSGCRADANEAAVILLPANITVFTLDFSGSGLSDGDFVSLGWHEKNDLKAVVSYLRSTKNVSLIGLWGRSMGAVTSLLYGAEDPSIAGMVLDSPFSNLFDLMMELVDVYKIRLPKFTVKVALQYMRRVIQKKANFDIMDLNAAQIAPKTFIPALFGHATEDAFIQPHHSDVIYKTYAGDKNIIKFEGDHNSARPQFYYDSVSIFFYNVLHPPQLSFTGAPTDRCFDIRGLRMDHQLDETLLYEMITGLESQKTAPASSSSMTCKTDGSSGNPFNKSIELAQSSTLEIENVLHETLDHNDVIIELEREEMTFSGKAAENHQNDESFSISTSNRESWGRCSSLGVSDEDSSLENFGHCSSNVNDEQKIMTSDNQKVQENCKDQSTSVDAVPVLKKSNKCEKFEALSQRVRLSILKRIRHIRHESR